MNVPQLQQEIKLQLVQGSEPPESLQGGYLEDKNRKMCLPSKLIVENRSPKVSCAF
jgi:hypothetical protein